MTQGPEKEKIQMLIQEHAGGPQTFKYKSEGYKLQNYSYAERRGVHGDDREMYSGDGRRRETGTSPEGPSCETFDQAVEGDGVSGKNELELYVGCRSGSCYRWDRTLSHDAGTGVAGGVWPYRVTCESVIGRSNRTEGAGFSSLKCVNRQGDMDVDSAPCGQKKRSTPTCTLVRLRNISENMSESDTLADTTHFTRGDFSCSLKLFLVHLASHEPTNFEKKKAN